MGSPCQELTGEVQAAAEERDGGLEALQVPVAAGLPFEGHNLAVQPFGHAIGDPMAAEGQDVLHMSVDQPARLAHRG